MLCCTVEFMLGRKMQAITSIWIMVLWSLHFIVVALLTVHCAADSWEPDFFELGTINYGHLVSSQPWIRRQEEMKMLFAMEEVGFMVLTNHGISKEVMDVTWNRTRDFFDSPLSNKKAVEMTKDYIYGYSADEILSKSEAIKYFKNGSVDDSEPATLANDQKEMFAAWIGAEGTGRSDAVLWPAEPLGLRESWTSYYRECEQIAAQLLRSFASILNLTAGHFEPFISDHMSAIRALNYPPQREGVAPPEGSMRCSAHSDYGTFTLLRQDGVGGLQLDVSGHGEWVDVISDHYDFIVNLGNTMKLWTNDRFKSTRHRVVNPRSAKERQRRQSIAFFHNLNGDALIETFPSCTAEDGTSKYAPIRFIEFLNSLHHGSQTNYGDDAEGEATCSAEGQCTERGSD